MRFGLIGVLAASLMACSPVSFAQNYLNPSAADATDLSDGLEHAVFASGCFWCTEADFSKLDGVVEVVSGFAGGEEANPDYYDVARGQTGHTEAARVIYDPTIISYERLLDHYWVNVDPFDGNGQFCDRGSGYAPYLFPVNASQQAAIDASIGVVEARFERRVAVGVESLMTFWPAGLEHQDYAERNPIRYQRYRFGCRRDNRLRQIWQDDALSGAP